MSTALEYISSFSHSGKTVTDLSRAKSLMSALGDPQDALRAIHIAGTNGKGSTARMLSGICIDAGLKTGLFTSPYIFRYNDRIKINGEDIPDNELEKLAETVKEAVDRSQYKDEFSQFEITMAIAFLYFRSESCDIVILESGLGGLLDCTNIIKEPLACVIGSVSFDHTRILGETISEIAYHKAGIIKKGRPCILSQGNSDEVIRVFSDKAAKEKAELIIPDGKLSIVRTDITGSDIIYDDKEYHIAMQGKHMIRNALSAIECIKMISAELGITYENVKKGLADAAVPARVQVLSEHPLLILDGAHNMDSMKALADTIKASGKRPVNAVIGMCRDKNMRSAVKELIGAADEFFTCDGFSDRAENADRLAKLISELGGKALPCNKAPYDKAAELAHQRPDSLTLICGSLYLCSEVLNRINEL